MTISNIAEQFLFGAAYDETTGRFSKLTEISTQQKDGSRTMRQATPAEAKLYRTVHLRRVGRAPLKVRIPAKAPGAKQLTPAELEVIDGFLDSLTQEELDATFGLAEPEHQS